MKAAQEQTGELRRVTELLAPSVVIIEQTSGLRTHCREAYEIYAELWAGTPYRVFHSTVDAARDCGGTHTRERLIWVAVR